MRPMRSSKRASLLTLGCRLNQAETAVLGERLRRDGYVLVEPDQPTDLLVINTCSVTEDAEKSCRYVVRKTLRRSPEAFVAVTGCYAQTGVDELRAIPGIDLVLGNRYKLDLPAYLPDPDRLRKQPKAEVLHSRTIDREEFELPNCGDYATTRALLKIQDGCNVMCSFCLIPFARGHERSRKVADILREAEALAAKGHREFVLTGVNIGRFSQAGLSLSGLIRRLAEVPGLDRIRISSIEPTTVTDDLLDCMASCEKLCPYLHVPLQSGDDGILAAMNRPYTAAEFESLIQKATRNVPGLGLGTDLMVGFPGEGDNEFARTVLLTERLPFSYFHVFAFSPRPGTAAFKMTGQVPARVAAERLRALSELSRNKRMSVHESRIGRTVSVLFESTESDEFKIGTTPDFMKVAVPCRHELRNEIRDVLITGAMDRWAVGRLAEEAVAGSLL